MPRRLRALVALFVPALLAAAPGCAGKGKKPNDPGKAAEEAPDMAKLTQPPQAKSPAMRLLAVDATRCDPSGKHTQQQDLNHDGRADLITLTIKGTG
ncbi:MAG: hypothetical protein KC486_27660, partial [Myxococcales bacterium]|nr:hypothetical protein [Myxococcales bacterium]